MPLPTPRRIPKELKTYKAWRAQGMQVQKGQKAHIILNGEVLFADWQVKPSNSDYGNDYDDAHAGYEYEGSFEETFGPGGDYGELPGPFGY